MRGSWWMANTGFSKARRRRSCKATSKTGRPSELRRAGNPMNISATFIHRPIATVLLMAGLLLGGLVTYRLLPVASLPNVNFPARTSRSARGWRKPNFNNTLTDSDLNELNHWSAIFPREAERHSRHYRRDDGLGGCWPAPERHCQSRGRIKLRHFTFSYRQYA